MCDAVAYQPVMPIAAEYSKLNHNDILINLLKSHTRWAASVLFAVFTSSDHLQVRFTAVRPQSGKMSTTTVKVSPSSETRSPRDTNAVKKASNGLSMLPDEEEIWAGEINLRGRVGISGSQGRTVLTAVQYSMGDAKPLITAQQQ